MHQCTPGPLVRLGSAPAPNSPQQACHHNSRHVGERGGRRGGCSPYCPKPYLMGTGCQLADKGETKHLGDMTAHLLQLCMPFVRGALVGKMQASIPHPALPLPGCYLPSSSFITDAQQLQDGVCSHVFLPTTKPCFGFGELQQSRAPVTMAVQAAPS